MIKYAMSLAVLALIGEVTAADLNSLQKLADLPSDEVCDGDANENRELEDEDDSEDDIVDDNGFSHQWLQTKLEGDHRKHMAMAEKKVLGHAHHKHHHKHHHKQHHMAQVQKAHKHHQKHHQKHHHHHGATQNQVDYLLNQHNNAGKHHNLSQGKPKNTKKVTGGGEKYSDQVANGDASDDKEVQDIQDPRDAIVDDNGFVNQYRTNWAQKQSRGGYKDYEGVQLGAELNLGDADEYTGRFNSYAQIKETQGSPGSFSQEIVDGDKTDDIQVEKEDTFEEDGAVEDSYLQLSASEEPHTSKGKQEEGSWWGQIRALAQQKKETDSMLLQLDDDINSDIGTLPGQTNRGYQSKLPVDYFAGNKIFDGHHITVPRDERNPGLGNNAYSQKYSDELANGDSADNREIHEEEDMNDAVVDYNGHTNRGYGSALPKDFFDRNHILPGHHITVPREEARNGLGNNVRAQLQNLRVPPQNNFILDDINSNIGTLPGQTNTGYQSMLPVDYFKQNQIMSGSHITIPKDEYRVTLGNNSH